MSTSTTTGNSSPFALCTVIRRTPSLPSSRIGASAARVSAASSRSRSTKPRNDSPPAASYCRASSPTYWTLASAWSPDGRSAKIACARDASSSDAIVAATGPLVAPDVQIAQQRQRRGDLAQRLGRVGRQFQRLERPEVPRARAVVEEHVVAEREQRAAQRPEHRQLVVRPLDRGERRAQRLDLLALVEALAADQQVRQAARLERLHVGPRDVDRRPVRTSACRSAGTAGRRRAPGSARARSGRSRSVTVQPLVVHQPVDEGGRPRRAALSASDGFVGRPRQSFGLRHGQRDDRRLARLGRPHRPPAARSAPARRRRSPVIRGANAALTACWIVGHGAEAAAQRHARGAVAPQLLAHRLVDADVGAAEAVDRLLRVADHEQLARARAGPRASRVTAGSSAASSSRISACSGSVSWNSSTNRCVKRCWNAARTSRAIAHEVARAHQQVEEVERADARLGVFVGGR